MQIHLLLVFHVCMYVCMYVSPSLFTHTHTHTHTHRSAQFLVYFQTERNLRAVQFLRTKVTQQYITPFFSLYIFSNTILYKFENQDTLCITLCSAVTDEKYQFRLMSFSSPKVFRHYGHVVTQTALRLYFVLLCKSL